jgi:hypothetical protein
VAEGSEVADMFNAMLGSTHALIGATPPLPV